MRIFTNGKNKETNENASDFHFQQATRKIITIQKFTTNKNNDSTFLIPKIIESLIISLFRRTVRASEY